jgi:Holliday junction resolvase RusA-like endonuclease
MRTTLARYELTSPLVPDGPVELAVFAYFTCPKTDWRKRDSRPRRWHTKKPDGDNILKAIKDAAKGVLWLDDSQVARATVEKIIAAQGEAPSVQVRVRRLEPLAALREEGACPS